MASLDAALSLSQVHCTSPAIRKDLKLYVPASLDIPLEIERRISKGCTRLG